MAKGREVLEMLIPDGGWAIYGDDYEGIQFIDCEPITKKQFSDGFAKYDAWKSEQDAAKETQRQAILDRIGLTSDEARLLLGS
jgi:hypothetical protein